MQPTLRLSDAVTESIRNDKKEYQDSDDREQHPQTWHGCDCTWWREARQSGTRPRFATVGHRGKLRYLAAKRARSPSVGELGGRRPLAVRAISACRSLPSPRARRRRIHYGDRRRPARSSWCTSSAAALRRDRRRPGARARSLRFRCTSATAARAPVSWCLSSAAARFATGFATGRLQARRLVVAARLHTASRSVSDLRQRRSARRGRRATAPLSLTNRSEPAARRL